MLFNRYMHNKQQINKIKPNSVRVKQLQFAAKMNLRLNVMSHYAERYFRPLIYKHIIYDELKNNFNVII